MLELMTGSLTRFAGQWRTWGLLAAVLGGALFAFTLVMMAIVAITFYLGLAEAPDPSNTVFPALYGLVLLALTTIILLWTAIWQVVFAGILRLALREVDDQTPPALMELPGLALTNLVGVLTVTLFTMVLGIAGLCLCVLPGLLAGSVFVWALPLVVDQGMDPLSAMRESARRFAERPLWTVGFTFLGTGVMMLFGQLLPLVGPGVGQVIFGLYLARGYRFFYPMETGDSPTSSPSNSTPTADNASGSPG